MKVGGERKTDSYVYFYLLRTTNVDIILSQFVKITFVNFLDNSIFMIRNFTYMYEYDSSSCLYLFNHYH